MLSCGKGTFSSFDIAANEIDSQQEEIAVTENENQDNTGEINSPFDEVEISEVIEPVMVTGAHLTFCVSLDISKVECTFADGAVADDFDISKVKIFDQAGNEIPTNLINSKIVESDGVSKLEITVSGEVTIASVGYEPSTAPDLQEENQDTLTDTDSNSDSPPPEENTESVETSTIDCSVLPGAWVQVPGDSDYGTSDFCVMKYEAKNIDFSPVSEITGLPWETINQADAISTCAALGNDYHLMSNEEWMTIAANAANVSSNWTGYNVGVGMLYIGHSDNDPSSVCAADADDSKAYVETDCIGKGAGADNELSQRRTHSLSNGQVIWDLSGNVREWISFSESLDKPSPLVSNYIEFTQPIVGSTSLPLNHLIPTQGIKAFWSDAWNSNQGIGMARIGTSGTGGALTRGGGFMGGNRNGLFRFRIDQDASTAVNTLGFRCSYTSP